VWLPKAEQGGLTIEKIAAGGRSLQVTLNQKKQAAIHERVQELITTVQPRVENVQITSTTCEAQAYRNRACRN
jgi:hypothetical protein